VMVAVTGSSLAERLSSIFFTATSTALLRMHCSTSRVLGVRYRLESQAAALRIVD
jgi:hypothetical protein